MNNNRIAPDLIAVCCPLCQNENNTTIVKTRDYFYDVPGTYSVAQCTQCRHRFLNPRPTQETLHLCYPEDYSPHLAETISTDRPTADTDSPQTAPWYLRFLPLRYVPGLKSLYHWLMNDMGQPLPEKPLKISGAGNPSILELGCSTGTFLTRLATLGWTVEGVEPSREAAEKARRNGLNVHIGVLDDIELPTASFDCAAAWMVIEHVFDPRVTLTQLRDLLKPNGQLHLSIPNAGCWEAFVFRSSWCIWEPPRHLHHFTPASITRLLEEAGFIDVKVVHQRNVLNLICSLGIALRRLPLLNGVGQKLLAYPNSPKLWIQLALSPIAHLLALLRQGGRLTIAARRPPDVASENRRDETGNP